MNQKQKYFLPFLLLFSAIQHLQSQPPSILEINCGNTLINAKSLKPYTNIWDMYYEKVTGEKELTGKWYDTVTMHVKKNLGTLQRKQTVRYTNGIIRKHFDEIYLANLMPVHTKITHHDKGKTSTIANVFFEKGLIRGEKYFNIEGEGSITQVKTTFTLKPAKPVYEWHNWGILIASLPLQNNFNARFVAHSSPGYNNSPFLWINVSVLNTENISHPTYANLECWKVKVIAESEWIFWIAKRKDVPPIQQIRIKDEENGYNWWMPEQ